jgi:hypothetical protein
MSMLYNLNLSTCIQHLYLIKSIMLIEHLCIIYYTYSAEFLWQEGHTAHATAADAVETSREILDMYASVCEVNIYVYMFMYVYI